MRPPPGSRASYVIQTRPRAHPVGAESVEHEAFEVAVFGEVACDVARGTRRVRADPVRCQNSVHTGGSSQFCTGSSERRGRRHLAGANPSDRGESNRRIPHASRACSRTPPPSQAAVATSRARSSSSASASSSSPSCQVPDPSSPASVTPTHSFLCWPRFGACAFVLGRRLPHAL
jgi:hypothetical protein